MESHWNSKNAILRDLSVAQGREVPVKIENPVAFNDKPPALNYLEETEEEFFADCVSGGDFNAGPDVTLIQQMLNMVREVNINDIENSDNTVETTLEITKSNPQVDEIKPVKTIRKKRNIAIESLLEAYGDNLNNNENNTNQILLKPDDIISEQKLDNDKSCKLNIIKSPTAMFKKKSLTKKEANVVQNNVSPITTDNFDKTKCGYFVPSSFADERYQKYLEKSKLQEQMKENIWDRAERQMKELDAKRKEEMVQNNKSPLPDSEKSQESEARGMDFVRLPQHRHLLTGDCIVCEVLCTHTNKDTNSDIA